MKWNEAPAISADIGSVMAVESGGDDNAVSPKGAKGKMQVLDSTMTSPGYNVIPARDSSKAERARVGEDYLTILQHKYGREGGLQAYNMGPGAYEEFKAGRRSLPAETAAYVPKVNKAGGGSSRWASAPRADEGPVSEGPQPDGSFRVEVRGVGDTVKPPVVPVEVAPTPQSPEVAPPTVQTVPPTAPEQAEPSAWEKILMPSVNTVRDAPTNFVAGAGKLMSIPIGAAVDVASGQKLGTDYKERARAIEDFRKENTHGDSWTTHVTQGAPEMIMSGGPVAGGTKALIAKGASPLLASVGINMGYEGAKSAAKGNDLSQIAEDTAWGAGGAAAGHAISRGVTGLRAGLFDAMRKFTDMGYVPTIGQMGGWLGKGYEKAASVIPGMPGAVERAAADASETVSRARANEALQAIGGRTNKTGNEAVKDMQGQISDSYSKVTPQIEVDRGLARIANLVSEHELVRSVPLLKGKAKDKIVDEIKTVTAPYISQRGILSGESFKKMDSELGELARKYERGTIKEQRMGAAIRTYQQNLRKTVYPKAGADPRVLDDLKAADNSFRQGVPVVDAAKRARAANGQFTATQDAAATDRARQPRSEAGAEIIANPSPAKEAQSTGSVIARYGAGSLAGYGAHAAGLTGQFLAGVPAVAAGAGMLAGGYAAHQLINTRAGRTALLNGLSGVIPKSALGKVSGLPPEEAARVLKEWMAKPEVASVAAQVGRQLTNGGQDAP